jgi:hypothetical protein
VHRSLLRCSGRATIFKRILLVLTHNAGLHDMLRGESAGSVCSARRLPARRSSIGRYTPSKIPSSNKRDWANRWRTKSRSSVHPGRERGEDGCPAARE